MSFILSPEHCAAFGETDQSNNPIWDIPKAVLAPHTMSRSLSSPHYATMLERLVEARRASGLKQVELAERLGKPQSFVSKIERGERRLDVIELLIIARAIDGDATGLFEKIARGVPQDARL